MTNSKKIQMFCISLEPSHFNFIKRMNYIPVGLGEKSLMMVGWETKQETIFQKKIKIMENILFTTGFGKITWKN